MWSPVPIKSMYVDRFKGNEVEVNTMNMEVVYLFAVISSKDKGLVFNYKNCV